MPNDTWFSELETVDLPGNRHLQMFVTETMRFLESVITSQDFRFLWGRDSDLQRAATQLFENEIHDSARSLQVAILEIPDRLIQSHGLSGRPLLFKFRVLRSIIRSRGKKRVWWRIRNWLKQVFDAIDVILDSLVAAAGGAGGALKEFKDALSALAGSIERSAT
jgi:hypothetical protein